MSTPTLRGGRHNFEVRIFKLCRTIIVVERTGVQWVEKTYKVCQNRKGRQVCGRSCSTQLLEVMNDWAEAAEAETPVDVIYLDYRKAYDSVPHKRLLVKLQACGIKGKLLRWIENFLTEREQQVVVNGTKSDPSAVISGIPQGSMLGPLLFLIYVNDLPEMVNSVIKLFADDTKLYRSINNESDRILLQKDLDAVMDWSTKWQLPFNTNKCKTMTVGAQGSIMGKYTIDTEGNKTVY